MTKTDSIGSLLTAVLTDADHAPNNIWQREVKESVGESQPAFEYAPFFLR